MDINTDNIVDINNKIIKLLNENIFLNILPENKIGYNICFDCDLWSNGIIIESDAGKSYTIEPISETLINILIEVECNLQSQLRDQNLMNFGYKSQIERLLCMIIDLKNKISAVRCINICNDSSNILSHLLHTLVQTLLSLMNILEVILALISQINNCCCSTVIVFDLFMGSLVNKITELQVLLRDWHMLVINFLSYSSPSTSPYIASYVPKQPIIPMQPAMQNAHACVPCPPNQNTQFINHPNNCNLNPCK
ncbi:hypothetical protein [Clostridium sp.]|uniref:hypothetical protein n=1 Tax=Clostridium sp. TaxID=1506 RepID=UPI003F30FAD7